MSDALIRMGRRIASTGGLGVLAALILGLPLGGCGGKVRWTAELVDESVRASVVRIEGRVLRGHCLSTDVVQEMALVEGEPSALPDAARNGDFGLAALAIDGAGAVVASGCLHLSLPTRESGTVVVPLRPGGGGGLCVVEVCNRRDDDCDGSIDEGIDLETDADNCGRCDRVCELDCQDGHCLGEAVEVATGSGHSCALRRSGHVFCWGNNSNGQLGDGTTYATRQCEDMLVGAAARHCALGNAVRIRADDGGGADAGMAPSVELTGVVDIEAGRDHACAVRDDGRVFCWGDGGRGRLGNGEAADRQRATPVVAVDGSELVGVVQVAAGHWPSCALHGDGTVACWGDIGRTVDDRNGSGTVDNEDYVALGISDRRNAEVVATLSGAVAIDVGYMHACAITGGRVQCWGTNDYGELGDGEFGRPAARDTPAAVLGITDAVSVGVGARYGCAVHIGGTVSCWGQNDEGQLGDGISHGLCVGVDCSTTPVAVSGLNDATVVSAGNNHTCALRASGTVVCWGSNNAGELGDGTTTPSGVPVGVLAETSEFVSVLGVAASMGGSFPHSCAVMDYGGVECWGSNWIESEGDPPVGTKWGRLGNVAAAAAESDQATTPIRVSGIP